jgi:pimeloyl-ACP methyl ester carboxylesterase
VVALDQREHGLSSPTSRDGSRVLADDVGHLLDALGWNNASLVGHPMGGQAAYQYADGQPYRVERLVAIDTGPELAPEGAARVRADMAGPDVFASAEEALTARWRWFPNVSEYLVPRADGTWT